MGNVLSKHRIRRSRNPVEATEPGVTALDIEGRFITLEFCDFFLVCQYTPCSGEQFENRDRRIAFDTAVAVKLTLLAERGKRILWLGDFNTIQTQFDAEDWEPCEKERESRQTMSKSERLALEQMVRRFDFVDTALLTAPKNKEESYTWFPTKGASAKRNGRRIDLAFWNGDITRVACRVRQDIKGSDHAPLELLLESRQTEEVVGPGTQSEIETVIEAVSTVKGRQRPWLLHLDVSLGEATMATAMIDSGSTVSLVDASLANRAKLDVDRSNRPRLTVANGNPMRVEGTSQVGMVVAGLKVTHTLLVTPQSVHPLLLGLDFLEKVGARVDYATNSFTMSGVTTKLVKGRIIGSGVSMLKAAPPHPVGWSEMPLKDIDLSKVSSNVTKVDAGRLKALIEEYHDVFARDNDFPGVASTPDFSMKIELSRDAKPMSQVIRKANPNVQKDMERTLAKYLAADIIEECSSPWNSRPLMVRKKDGSYRMAIDYRQLNKETVRDLYPMPTDTEVAAHLVGAKFYTVMDMVSGYHQILIDELSRDLTAFGTGHMQFRFRVMPFGLTNAPAKFNRWMDTVMKGLKGRGVVVFMDDILVYSETVDGHLSTLRKVFTRMRQHSAHFKAKKCDFMRDRIDFIGHTFSSKGVEPSSLKTESIRLFPRPTDVTELRRFLGLVGYYRKFIKNFSAVAKPLTEMTKTEKARSVRGPWPPDAMTSFDALRNALATAPILAHPSWDRPFEVHTDASDVGLSGILHQRDDEGRERVIAYASRGLHGSEPGYLPYERELLAIAWALDHFRFYIRGSKTIVKTDCGALPGLVKKEPANSRVFRWLLRMAEFDYEVAHRSGKSNPHADALSRKPTESSVGDRADADCGIRPVLAIEEDEADETVQPTEPDPCTFAGPHNFQGEPLPTSEEMKRLQDCDKDLQTRALKGEYGRGNQDVLVKSFVNPTGGLSQRVVVPEAARLRVLYHYHGAPITAHVGTGKCVAALKRRFWWKGMGQDARRWIRSCLLCAKRKRTRHVGRGPLGSIVKGLPMRTVYIDIVGPLPQTDRGNVWILTMVDSFTRFPIAIALPNRQSTTVARAIFEHLICMFGLPRVIFSDRAKEFGATLRAVCLKLGISKIETTGYQPQANGQVERFHRFLNETLTVLADTKVKRWEEYLPIVLFA